MPGMSVFARFPALSVLNRSVRRPLQPTGRGNHGWRHFVRASSTNTRTPRLQLEMLVDINMKVLKVRFQVRDTNKTVGL